MDFQENDEYDSRMMGCENKIEKIYIIMIFFSTGIYNFFDHAHLKILAYIQNLFSPSPIHTIFLNYFCRIILKY